MTLRLAKSPGLLPLALGVLGLAAVVVLLPFLGDSDTLAGFVAAYVLVLLPTGSLLYGLLVLAADSPVPKLLFLGVVAGTVGVATTYLGGRPEKLVEGPAPEPLALLFFADVLRMCAAACLGLALARCVISPGVALLIAGLATAADLFSVFAGPTRALVEKGVPALDYLLLIFPTFGYPLGFALGVADFIFLALFSTVAHRLEGLRPFITLSLGCAAVLLAMLVGLLLETALPALPFIALSFILANATPLYRSLLAQ